MSDHLDSQDLGASALSGRRPAVADYPHHIDEKEVIFKGF